jgi:hypothetical protein
MTTDTKTERYIADHSTGTARAFFPDNAEDKAELERIRKRIRNGEPLQIVHVDMKTRSEEVEDVTP